MTRTLTIAAVTIALAMGTSYATGMRWNVTPSMPLGLWQIRPIRVPVQRGDVITLCLERDAAALGRERGYLSGGECPGDVELLVKSVAAIPGDDVEITGDGMTVNGALLPTSKPLPRDDRGQPLRSMWVAHYHVATGQVWVIGTADDRSFDSRYFGAVPIANLRGQARPLLVTQGNNR